MLESNGDRDRVRTVSEIVSVDERNGIISPVAPPPNIANLNVTRSSKVHIGSKFVSVTQNVHNPELVKGRCLCLDLVAPIGPRGMRCGVAVFVCWALIVAIALILYFIYIVLPSQRIRLDIGLNTEWYLRRGNWQAMPAYKMDFLNTPLSNVIIGHTAGNYCNTKYTCIKEMLSVQRLYLKRQYDDIGPNFLVGGKGFIFEGRGANVQGAMIKSWNQKSITIMFLGNYMEDEVDQLQINNLNTLLETLVRERVLEDNYNLYAHCQIRTQFVAPGSNVISILKNFSHWNPSNISGCPKKL